MFQYLLNFGVSQSLFDLWIVFNDLMNWVVFYPFELLLSLLLLFSSLCFFFFLLLICHILEMVTHQ